MDLRSYTLFCVVHKSNLGGAPLSCLAHCRAVRDEFSEVRVILNEEGPLQEKSRREGLRCETVPIIHEGLRSGRTAGRNLISALFHVLRSRLAYMAKIRGLFRSTPCIVHVHSSTCIYALIAARLAQVPVIAHVRETRRNGCAEWLRERILASCSTVIITVSDGIARGYGRAVKAKATTVYNYVEHCEMAVPSASPAVLLRIGFVGVIRREKGLEEFLRVCARLLQEGRSVEAVAIGSFMNDDTEQWCRKRVSQLGIEKMIRFKGAVDDPGEIYRDIHVLFHPSHFDALPRTIMEAMACGLPVVATDVGGIPEMVVHGQTGFLAPKGAVGEMTAYICRLMDEPELRREMGRAGRQRAAELFEKSRYKEAIVKLYAAAVSKC